jgi:hypothetical protein
MFSVTHSQRIVEQLGSVCPAAACKAAETFAKMPGSKVIKHAQAHRHMTASSSVLHSRDDKGNPIPFTLNTLTISAFRSIKRGRKRTRIALD